ncbi:MAG: helix-turn-helix transcriptional regulator [Pseudomonadota bacterium]
MISLAASFAISRAIELRSRNVLRKNAGITKRELECLKWAADGKTEWEIGVVLGIAEKTVDTHLYSAHRKLGAANRPQAIALAFRLGLID